MLHESRIVRIRINAQIDLKCHTYTTKVRHACADTRACTNIYKPNNHPNNKQQKHKSKQNNKQASKQKMKHTHKPTHTHTPARWSPVSYFWPSGSFPTRSSRKSRWAASGHWSPWHHPPSTDSISSMCLSPLGNKK